MIPLTIHIALDSRDLGFLLMTQLYLVIVGILIWTGRAK